MWARSANSEDHFDLDEVEYGRHRHLALPAESGNQVVIKLGPFSVNGSESHQIWARTVSSGAQIEIHGGDLEGTVYEGEVRGSVFTMWEYPNVWSEEQNAAK